jgi:hypothetical protein
MEWHESHWRRVRQHRFSVRNYDGWQQSWPYPDPPPSVDKLTTESVGMTPYITKPRLYARQMPR